MGIIYKCTNLITNESYIGQTKYHLEHRKSQHLYLAFYKKPIFKFQKALRKYGSDLFEWSIIWEGDDLLLNDMEIFYISKYNSYYKGYNMTLGGNNTCIIPKLYNFYNKNGINEYNISIPDFSKKYNLNIGSVKSLVHSRISVLKGWAINESNLINVKIGGVKKGYKHKTKYNTRLRSFIHISGNQEIDISQIDFANKYNLKRTKVSSLCRGEKGIYKGWKLLK